MGEVIAEVDFRNLKTWEASTEKFYTLEEVSRLRVGMVVDSRGVVDGIWLFPETLGRDYPMSQMGDWKLKNGQNERN